MMSIFAYCLSSGCDVLMKKISALAPEASNINKFPITTWKVIMSVLCAQLVSTPCKWPKTFAVIVPKNGDGEEIFFFFFFNVYHGKIMYFLFGMCFSRESPSSTPQMNLRRSKLFSVKP